MVWCFSVMTVVVHWLDQCWQALGNAKKCGSKNTIFSPTHPHTPADASTPWPWDSPPAVVGMPTIGVTDPASLEPTVCTELVFCGGSSSTGTSHRPPPYWWQRRLSCVVLKAAAWEISCGGGNRCLSLIHLSMGFAPLAILPVWEWVGGVNCWGQSSEPRYLCHCMARHHPWWDGWFYVQRGGWSILPPGNLQTPWGARRHKDKGIHRRLPEAEIECSV